MVLRAASSPISTTTAAALSTVSQQFLRAFDPYSAGAALLAAGTGALQQRGTTRIPVARRALGLATFIAEGSPIPAWN